jgi:predicted O-methyltransferase YrrM
MFVSLVSYLNPEIIIESGRARGFSTRVICEFFIDENKKIFSIEKDKYNRDFRYAENNLEYLYNKKCNFKKLLGKYIVSLKNKFYNYV